MTLQRAVYEVALNTPDGIAVHQVAVSSGDRMRAELEAPKHKLATTGPYNNTSLWLWCALVRTGVVTAGYQEFRNELLEEFNVVHDAAGQPVLETVDPTRPATGAGSHSLSPLTSEAAPPTGSIPTSTSSY